MSQESHYFSIKDWSESDRPREKLLQKGSAALSDAELIAILIGSGTRKMSAVELSRLILNSVNNSLDRLGKSTLKNLMSFKGIGEAKAITIAAAMELGRRRAMEMPLITSKITCSKDGFSVLQPILGDLAHEEFWVLLMDNSHKILAKKQISKGGFTGTLVDVRIIFQEALMLGAVSIMLAHNHPSGTLKPSVQDRQITDKILTASKTMDIRILDHLIITQRDYYSFADNGML
ncbi:MAG: DNA repair protein RadC [Nonlabens sp.]